MLEEIGYRVRSAGDPLEAVSLFEKDKESFDIVITDVVMPGMSGRDLMNRLKSISPDVKVLFMSGYTSNVIARRAVLEEGVHFVQKPFSMNVLARKIREAMGNG
jgi:DNA-binding NtrC family response regulator